MADIACQYKRHRLKQRLDFIAALDDRLDLAILTRISCTAPQKQVAVASSSVDQPSFERFTTEKALSSGILMISRLLNHFVQTDTELQKDDYPE